MQDFTPKQIACVFAMHLDGKVRVPALNETFLIAGVDLMNCTVNCAANYDAVDDSWMMFEDCKIELTPMPKISDEHFVELANIIDCFPYGWSASSANYGIGTDTEERSKSILVQAVRAQLRITRKSIELTIDGTALPVPNVSLGFQYLASQGYAIPLHALGGKTAIEAGLAIDTTIVKVATNA